MLPVNAFLQFTNLDDLYYALIGGKANIFDFELEVLGIDAAADADEGLIMRGGFATSGVSKQERVINRFDNGISSGLNYWLSFDFDDNAGANESIYADPLDFAFAGGEAIFSLPNGLQAYYVANAAGTRLNEAPAGVVIDPSQNNGTVTNGASCHSCHNAGMIPFDDTVLGYVLSNPRDFDAQTFEDVQEQYPTQDEWNAIFEFDSKTHVDATVRAGVPEGTPDPIGRVFLEFQLGDVTTNLAAGELGVTPEELMADANRLDPRFDFSIADGRTDRNTFTDAYLDSLCIMQSFSQNQPANCP
jgi:serine/threonine-protein kinase